jgi:peptidoglycan/LPS O-acetylase OafA/YrhL
VLSPQMPWHLDKGRKAGEMGYQPGLDGVRALAIIGVLLYHADFDWLPGGFLGVDVFFVLSGFLITTLIIEEFERSGRVDFRRFYIRRARRLLPALFLMLFVVGVFVALFARDAARAFGEDAASALLYVTNWWFIFADQSYFESIGRPALLRHLWSLAVEEQFYLIWPAIAYLLLRRNGRPLVRWVALGAALLSTAWMAFVVQQSGAPEFADASRAYFGTDTHLMGLLIGAALATVWRPGQLPTVIRPQARVILTAIGVAAILGTIWFFVFVTQFTGWLYRGGFLILALVVALVIATATHPALPIGRWLGSQPWRYIGQRSYGLYLWHWPIFMLTRPILDVPFDGLVNLGVRLALTFTVAEISFRFVEMPIRRGVLATWWKRYGPKAFLAPIVVLVVAVAVLAASLFSTARPSLAEGLAPDVAVALGVADGGPLEVLIDEEAVPAAPEVSDAAANGPMSVLGDSVVLGARSTIRDVIPGAKVDAEVARMPGAFIGRIKKLRARDKLSDVVVLHPGTNGVLPESMMREMLDLLAEVPTVLVVNSQMPRTWRKPNNDVIRTVVEDYPNATVVDWFRASKDEPNFFASDGIHLTPAGARTFATLIKQAAEQGTAPAPGSPGPAPQLR